MYEELFQRLLVRCQTLAPHNKRFKFKESAKLYLLDVTMIDLSLSLFPWVKYRKRKGAEKLHIGLYADSYLPTFVDLSEGKEHEVKMARQLKLLKFLYCF